jgi:hypothetical protein
VLLLPQARSFIIKIAENILGRELNYDVWMKIQLKFLQFAILFFSFFLLLLLKKTLIPILKKSKYFTLIYVLNKRINNQTTVIKFLIILFLNILFFILSSYFLPVKFQTNDDAAMCLIANGTWTGTPETRLIFINVVYGIILSLFYKMFGEIEWYTVFFSIIHIISLSVIVYSFIKTDKAKPIKFITIILIYVLELTIIQNLQFTTTASIAAFAGTILLLTRKSVYNICGVILFIIGTLVRFHSGMLVMLLMLPCFYIQYFSDEKNIKGLIYVVICIFSGFIFHIIDKQAYQVDEWSYYYEYNAARGYLLGNPNRYKIIDNLPDDISKNDFTLFLAAFPDGKYLDLTKLLELKQLVTNISLIDKLKNIKQFIKEFIFILRLILISLVLLILSADKKYKIFFVLYFLFLILVYLYISFDGLIHHRVFLATLFPIIYFIYINAPMFPKYISPPPPPPYQSIQHTPPRLALPFVSDYLYGYIFIT